MKRRRRQVMGLEDFTEADIAAVRKVEPPAEAAAFDHEVDDAASPSGGVGKSDELSPSPASRRSCTRRAAPE